jgi:hypothetical protein
VTTNRIQRYERLWSAEAPTTRAIPQGFAVMSLGHLSPAQQSAVAAQRDLYQLAFDRAQAEADERFVNDWMI